MQRSGARFPAAARAEPRDLARIVRLRARAERRGERVRIARRHQRAELGLVIRSGTPPTAVATTRRPHASASSTTFGVPSAWLGSTSTSQAAIQVGTVVERLAGDEAHALAERRAIAASSPRERPAADDDQRRVGQRGARPSPTPRARSSTPFSSLRLPT